MATGDGVRDRVGDALRSVHDALSDRAGSDYPRRALSAAALGLILLLVFTTARIPHGALSDGAAYDLPLHMDEYLHWGKASAVERQGTTSYGNPWFGGTPDPKGNLYHEVGFHVFWAATRLATDIPWPLLFAYGPGAVLALTALGAYVLGRPHGFGHEAALFTALIPTSVRFLGPAFLVPITFAFPLVVGALAVAFHPGRRRRGDGRDTMGRTARGDTRAAGDPRTTVNLRTTANLRAAGALFVLAAGLWLIHARAAAFVVLPALLAAAVHARRDRWLGAALAVAVVAPFLWALPLFLDAATSSIILEEILPIDRAFFDNFGVVTLVLFGLGAAFAVGDTVHAWLGRRERDAGGPGQEVPDPAADPGPDPPKVPGRADAWVPLVLALSAFLAFFFIFVRAIYRVNLFTMYSRAHMLFFVTAAPVAGYGLARILRSGLARGLRARRRHLPAARMAAVLLALLAVTPALAQHQDEPYYHVIEPADYDAFMWIDRNLDDRYDKALMLPWHALAFSAATGRESATVQFPGDTVSRNDLAFQFFRTGGQDTQLLRRNQIGVVYSPFELDNPELREVRDGVYILLPPGGQAG